MTNISSSIIDLIYTSDERLHSGSGVLKTTISDHYSVYTIINLKSGKSSNLPFRTIQRRNYKKIDCQLLLVICIIVLYSIFTLCRKQLIIRMIYNYYGING